MKRASNVLLYIFIMFLLKMTAQAQQIPPSISESINKTESNKSKLATSLKKINSHLHAIVQSEQQGLYKQNIIHEPLLEINADGKIHVLLRTSEISDELLRQLAAIGFDVETTTKSLPITDNQQMICGWIHCSQIEQVAKLSAIFHIRTVDHPIPNIGAVTTPGDHILRADDVRMRYGITGAGEKVGAISNGIDNWIQVQATADLPEIHIVRNRFSGDEGTAMLEIIHDLAPDAELAFADWGNSQVDFAYNILLLRNAGCTVITDDITYLLEPVYEDGVVAQTIEDVVLNSNIVYTSSVGNFQKNHYEGLFHDNNSNGFHEFDAQYDETINVSLSANSTIYIIFQWNNKYGSARDDYDIYLYDESWTNILASSTNIQDGNDDPLEHIAYNNAEASAIKAYIVVKKVSGESRDFTLNIFDFSSNGGFITLEEYVGGLGSIFGHPAAEHCLATAAINANDPDFDTIEDYSSLGPVRIYEYDQEGNPLQFVERLKPDHAAIDGVETRIGQLGFFINPFFGTSAATPHTAGIAALVRQAAASFSATEVNELINSSCIDIVTADFDYYSGYGRIDAINAISSLGAPPEITYSPDVFSVAILPRDSIMAFLELSNNGDLPLSFEISAKQLSKTVTITDEQQPKYPNHTQKHRPVNSNQLQGIRQLPVLQTEAITGLIFLEGFESGVMPPEGWFIKDGNSTPGQEPAHWRIEQGSDYVYSGMYSALCPFGFNLDEWLITPPFDFSPIQSAELEFKWQSSYYWHVYPYDYGDLFVEISTDNGATWTTVWSFGNIGPWASWNWQKTNLNLSNYAGQSSVTIAFHIVANDNADIVIDEIILNSLVPEPSWVTFAPKYGEIIKDSTTAITCIFRSADIEDGNYNGEIQVDSNDPEHQQVAIPVHLRIGEVNDLTINGHIRYYSQAQGIEQVQVALSDMDTVYTDSLGFYEFRGLAEGDYYIQPRKYGVERKAITAADASLILQHNVHLIQLNPFQQIAGDISGNHRVTHYDASLILRYCVGALTEFPAGNGWIFIPTDLVLDDTNWYHVPNAITLNPLNSDTTNQDFHAIVYGDVDGSWYSAGREEALVNAIIRLAPADFFPDSMVALPLSIEHTGTIFSGEIEFVYDKNFSDNWRIDIVQATNMTDEMFFEKSISDSTIKLAFASAKGISYSGNFFEIHSSLIGNIENHIRLVKVILNGFDMTPLLTEEHCQPRQGLPATFYLAQNYPNPFNPITKISYQIPHLSLVNITIYNMLGQKIRTIVDNNHEAGFYDTFWSGTDNMGRAVASGIYFCKIQAENFNDIKKMLLMR